MPPNARYKGESEEDFAARQRGRKTGGQPPYSEDSNYSATPATGGQVSTNTVRSATPARGKGPAKGELEAINDIHGVDLESLEKAGAPTRLGMRASKLGGAKSAPAKGTVRASMVAKKGGPTGYEKTLPKNPDGAKARKSFVQDWTKPRPTMESVARTVGGQIGAGATRVAKAVTPPVITRAVENTAAKAGRASVDPRAAARGTRMAEIAENAGRKSVKPVAPPPAALGHKNLASKRRTRSPDDARTISAAMKGKDLEDHPRYRGYGG